MADQQLTSPGFMDVSSTLSLLSSTQGDALTPDQPTQLAFAPPPPPPVSQTLGDVIISDQPSTETPALSTDARPSTAIGNNQWEPYFWQALQALPQQPRSDDDHLPNELMSIPSVPYFDTNVREPLDAPAYWKEQRRLVGVLFTTTPAGYPSFVSNARLKQKVYVRLPSNHLAHASRYEPAVIQAVLTNHLYIVSIRDHQRLYAHVSTLRQRFEHHTRPYEILATADRETDECKPGEASPARSCPCHFRNVHNAIKFAVFKKWLVITDQDQRQHWVSLAQPHGDWTPLEQLIASLPVDSDHDRSVQLIEVHITRRRARELIERLKRVTLVRTMIYPLDKQFQRHPCAQDFINLMSAFPQLDNAYNLPNLDCVPAHMLSHYTDFSYRHFTGSEDFTLLSVQFDVVDASRSTGPRLYLETNLMEGFLTELNKSYMRFSAKSIVLYAHNANWAVDRLLEHLRTLYSWPTLTRVTLRIHVTVEIPVDALRSLADVSDLAKDFVTDYLPVVAACRTWLNCQPEGIHWHVTVCADLHASHITQNTDTLVDYILRHLQHCSQLPTVPHAFANKPFTDTDPPGSVPPEFFPAGHRLRQRLMIHQGHAYPHIHKPLFTTESKEEQLQQQLAWEARLRA